MKELTLLVKEMPAVNSDERLRKLMIYTRLKTIDGFRKPTEAEVSQSRTFMDTPELVYTVAVYKNEGVLQ